MKIDWKTLVKTIVPLILPFINPRLAPLGPVIANGIQEAESIPGASGADKLQHVTNIAVQAAQGINVVAGKDLVDPVHVQQTAADAISTVVDITNLVHKNQDSTSVTTTTTSGNSGGQ
jgi:hypothetical protein